MNELAGDQQESVSDRASTLIQEDVLTQDGQLVAHFQSDPMGHFFIPLPPGTYTVQAAKPDDGQPATRFDVPRVSPQDVTVSSGGVEQVQVRFDTGIR